MSDTAVGLLGLGALFVLFVLRMPVGLSMLIMSITDTPRLLLAMFLGGDASFVKLLGWITWVAAGALSLSLATSP